MLTLIRRRILRCLIMVYTVVLGMCVPSFRVITVFMCFVEMQELQKRCNEKTLDGSHLELCEVPPPTCIAVSSDEDITSIETVRLYFELPKNGGKFKHLRY